MIEPEAAPRPATPARASVIGIALLVALAVAVALVAPRAAGPDRLALAASGAGANSERSAAPASATGEDASTAIFPGYRAVDYRFEGRFPDLGAEAAAWRLGTPPLGVAGARRFAAALGLPGEPERRDGGWFLETGEGALSIFPSGDGWSVNFSRSPATGAVGSATLGEGNAERIARRVLDRMGVLEGEWRVEAYRTEFGVAVGCAVPEGGIPAEEAEKLRRAEEAGGVDADAPVSSDRAPAATGPTAGPDRPAATPDVAADCPEPEPPVPGWGVSFFPVLGDVRAEWAGWGVMVRGDGRVENLYGTWATFERAGEYKLRDVEAAFEELRGGEGSDLRILAGQSGAAADDAVRGVAPAEVPAIEPVEPVEPVEPAERQVVIMTAVERSLIPSGVWTGDGIRLHLVPGYHFTGAFESGDPFQTSVVALHPDAIAPAPAVADEPGQARPEPLVDGDGRAGGGAGSSGSGGGSTPGERPVAVTPAKG